MRTIIVSLFLVLFSSLSFAGCIECHAQTVHIPTEVVKTAEKYLYVREAKNNNRSPEIDKWHKKFGIPYGNPYCAMFALNSYMEPYEALLLKSPLPKYARVATFAKWSTRNPLVVKPITVKQIQLGIYKPEPGDIICWMHGRAQSANTFNWDGHMGIVKKWNKSIEGNTKPSDKGDQTGRTIGDTKYGNDGVYERTRGFGVGTSFPILYFVRLQKPEVVVK